MNKNLKYKSENKQKLPNKMFQQYNISRKCEFKTHFKNIHNMF